nr:histone deacetylase 14 [Tanacetum cinerariifolium]
CGGVPLKDKLISRTLLLWRLKNFGFLMTTGESGPRDSPLYLPNEEPVLGYLKFSAKGTKREVFGMPIPGNLIINDIKGEPYYEEYLEKVAKHQRYLAGDKESDPDSPAPKPTKATKKSKPSAPKVDLRPLVTKLTSSQQPEPKPAPAKCQGKKIDGIVEEAVKALKKLVWNVHRNLIDWIALRLFNIQIAVACSYRHPSEVRQDLIISTSRWCHCRSLISGSIDINISHCICTVTFTERPTYRKEMLDVS